MTGETLYEQIAEHKQVLNSIEGEDDDENNDAGNEKSGDRSVRGQSGHERGKQPIEAEISELGGAADRGNAESGSRDAGGLPRENGGESRGDIRSSQKDGGAPQKDGEDLQVEKPPTTNAEWAKLRREAREAKAELARLKAERAVPAAAPVAAATEAKPTDKSSVPEIPECPKKEENYQGWLEWQLEHGNRTVQEQAKIIKDLTDWKADQEKTSREEREVAADVEAFTKIEERYIEKNPDYSTATEYARNVYFDALKKAMPQALEAQINWAIDKEILDYARKWAADGLDPAEEFYSMAQERFGYVPKSGEQQEELEEHPEKSPLRRAAEKPNLKTIATNKRRSASPLSGGGQGSALPITLESVADMSMGEFSRLTPQEIAALEADY